MSACLSAADHELDHLIHSDGFEDDLGVAGGEDPEDLVAESLANHLDAGKVEDGVLEFGQTLGHPLRLGA